MDDSTSQETTVQMVLVEIKRQLDWRGPSGRVQGHVVLPRNLAERLLAEPVLAGLVAKAKGRLTLPERT